MNRRLVISVALLALATAAGCSGYRPAPPAFHAALTKPYVLDSGDRVRITVFEQESLSNVYSVDQAGYIAFPLVGAVAARGQSASAVERQIAGKLRNGYLRNPDVSVEIDRYRPIFVTVFLCARHDRAKGDRGGRRIYRQGESGRCRHHPRH